MGLKIYNTMTGAKEDFKPLREGKVGMYVCGVTVYDHTHLGHARSAVIFDVIRRYLEYSGYEVKYVRNFTDVDDKIIARAQREGVACNEIAERFIEEYYQHMGHLGVRDADVAPRATEHIPQMIEMIGVLLNKGFAYRGGGSVYYSVKKIPSYGKLSKRDTDQLLAGARVEIDENKKDPLDFALWKEPKEGEPAWESPWGLGRPGWHIECSAMVMKHLGETADIHGGGKDLVFPHHENEIAQSEACTGKQFVRFWLHNGFVNVNEEKMSKSTGNFFTVKEVLESYRPEAVRFFLLSTHYRNPIDYGRETLLKASRALERYYSMMRDIEAILGTNVSAWANKDGYEIGPSGGCQSPPIKSLHPQKELLDGPGKDLCEVTTRVPAMFREAMDDDFNTARAIGEVFGVVNRVNNFLHQRGRNLEANELRLLGCAREALHEIGGVLGLFTLGAEQWFKSRVGLKTIPYPGEKLDEGYINQRIIERDAVRRKRDWVTADRIRRELAEMGLILEDTPQGTRWKVRD